MTTDTDSNLYYRVSDLPIARRLDGSEVVEIIQHGENVKLSVAELINDSEVGSKILRQNDSTDDLFFGQPVYAMNAVGVGPADARYANKKVVIGLVSYPLIASNGGEGKIQTSGVLYGTIAQWEFATGMVGGLVLNYTYYLDKYSGRITPIPPSEEGCFLTEIGTAISQTELSIAIQRPLTL